MPPPLELVRLAHAVGEPVLGAAILAEGNVSAQGEEGTFWVKASGAQMAEIDAAGFVEVNFKPVLDALDLGLYDEKRVRSLLNGARANPNAEAVPSTEAFMHAFLLSLPEIQFVAHTHPVALLSLTCLDAGSQLAKKRLFPDEVVLCGAATCWVPYTAPGLPLAVEIRAAVTRFRADYGVVPKTIWLQNHGLITLGSTAREAETATRMGVKAACVALGALQTKLPIRWLSEAEIQQISSWPDEHYRQRLLWG